MISFKVSYTINPSFLEQNKKNINTFLEDFKKIEANFFYNVFLQEDGLTFLHISMYENEAVQNTILNTPSFLKFQAERDESGLNNTHQLEKIHLLGSSLRLI
ncbi:MAG: hypothetical protein EOO47_15890 [Flavobacterium sp.]|nr:MAG: hypothetical protein EOO47_15890 [Flavobacterium sp.]